MTCIRWTTEAAGQLEGIAKHILKDNPEAARKVARTILGRIADLKDFPRLGRPRRGSRRNPRTAEPTLRYRLPPQG